MNNWEKRWNPLRQEWIVYAAHRNQRPWDGEAVGDQEVTKSYLENCYLCPGNTRVGGKQNPDYSGVFIFDNDHPVVGENAPEIDPNLEKGWYKTESAKGFAKVICYDRDHSKTMSDLPQTQLVHVIKAWKSVTLEAKERGLEYVLVFENKGAITGVSNLHPHCQAYATDFVFNHTKIEIQSLKKHQEEKQENLFEALIKAEQISGDRIIVENDYAIAFIPFFAKYAYEVMLFPKTKASTLLSLSDLEINGIAEVYQTLIKKYDALFKMNFPYVMSIMQAPLQGDHSDYSMYFHFQPPLRLPGIRKYLAGPEIGGGNFMADTMPEASAKQLREM